LENFRSLRNAAVVTAATILLGTYNRVDLLRQCVESVLRHSPSRYKLIVADAGSTDGTIEYLESQPSVQLVRDPGRIGQARSLNQLAAMVSTDYLCWISDDNILRHGSLDIAVSTLNQDPAIGMVALKVKDVTGAHTHRSYLGAVSDTGILNVNQGMLRTSVFKEIGGFDEIMRDYYIDVDITTKVLLKGYDVVYTKAVAIDHYRDHDTSNWIEPNARPQRLKRNRAYYVLRYPVLVQENEAYLTSANSRRAERLERVRWILKWMSRIGRVQNSYSEHDWNNISEARFISPLDFVLHSGRPYYLRQRMGTALRDRALQELHQPTMEEAEAHIALWEERRRKVRALNNKRLKERALNRGKMGAVKMLRGARTRLEFELKSLAKRLPGWR
jgi:GT2 family glycosyltransferase